MDDMPYYLPHELTEASIKLILNCPYLINRLSASLEKMFENLCEDNSILEPIEIKHVEYSSEALGYNDTK